jgi:trans-aconitate methyltransferase
MRVDNVSDSSQILDMQSPTHSQRAARAQAFTPAFPVLALYDPIVRLLTREARWRPALLARLAPRDGETIVDAGCGTGTFLASIGQRAPGAFLIGVDPDERIRERARAKLGQAGIAADVRSGYLRDLATLPADRPVQKITSSLVFHQIPMAEKVAGLDAIFTALAPGGELLIADYGLQRTIAMRVLFRVVQYVDGFTDTQPNADGVMPALMRDAGFVEVAETDVFATATGSISIYRARKPRC